MGRLENMWKSLQNEDGESEATLETTSTGFLQHGNLLLKQSSPSHSCAVECRTPWMVQRMATFERAF